MPLDLTEVFRPWVLVALAMALVPFAIVVARRLRHAFGGTGPAA